jgi:hypothetical protein
MLRKNICGFKRDNATAKWNYSGDQIIKIEVDRSCDMWETEEVHTEFWWGDLRERDNL